MAVQITLKKSLIGRRPRQVATARALGLKRIGQSVVKEQNDAINGMIKAIGHLVEVKEV